jgi:hypothetical protein
MRGGAPGRHQWLARTSSSDCSSRATTALGASGGPPARERVVLFNAVTVITLAIGIATLYLVPFVGMILGAA